MAHDVLLELVDEVRVLDHHVGALQELDEPRFLLTGRLAAPSFWLFTVMCTATRIIYALIIPIVRTCAIAPWPSVALTCAITRWKFSLQHNPGADVGGLGVSPVPMQKQACWGEPRAGENVGKG